MAIAILEVLIMKVGYIGVRLSIPGMWKVLCKAFLITTCIVLDSIFRLKNCVKMNVDCPV